MVYVPEKEIKGFVKKNNLPVIGKCCSQDGFTKREYMKNLFKTLSKDIPCIRASVFGAITRSNIKRLGR